MALQWRDDPARVEAEGAHPSRCAERVEMDGEQHVGRLGLPVGGPLVVTALELHVVPAHPRAAMTERRHRHHPGADAGDRRPQPVDEGEVAEMIGRELRLPPGPDTGLGARHDPGVGDQQINAPTRRQEPFGERGDTVEIAQIELVDLNTVDTSQRLGSRGGAAGRHHDTGAGADQGARRLQPNAGVAASHHRQPASQIDAFEHVGGRRRGTEPGTDGALRGKARCHGTGPRTPRRTQRVRCASSRRRTADRHSRPIWLASPRLCGRSRRPDRRIWAGAAKYGG